MSSESFQAWPSVLRAPETGAGWMLQTHMHPDVKELMRESAEAGDLKGVVRRALAYYSIKCSLREMDKVIAVEEDEGSLRAIEPTIPAEPTHDSWDKISVRVGDNAAGLLCKDEPAEDSTDPFAETFTKAVLFTETVFNFVSEGHTVIIAQRDDPRL